MSGRSRFLVVLVVLSGLATAVLGLAGNVASGLFADVAKKHAVAVWVAFGVALLLTIVLGVALLRADGVHQVELDGSSPPLDLDDRQRKLHGFYEPGTAPYDVAPERSADEP